MEFNEAYDDGSSTSPSAPSFFLPSLDTEVDLKSIPG